MTRKPYPSDVSDDEWAFMQPYLVLMDEDAPQRVHSLREVYNALRYVVRTGVPWRMLPHDLPPWPAVYQQMCRWRDAEVFETMADDLRQLLRLLESRDDHPTAAILDSRTLQSTPESGARAGYDGAKRKQGSKVHLAVDTLGHLLALYVTPANEQDRDQVAQISAKLQQVTEEQVEVLFVDQGYTGDAPAQAAAEHGIQLQVVKLPESHTGFVLLPKRWVVERSFAWLSRFRRLARDYERLASTLSTFHFMAFAMLMAQRFVQLLSESH